MTYVLDPFSASVAGWTLLGKTIEQQLRVGTAVQQAMFASFGFSPLKSPDSAPETVSNFISKRTEIAPKKAKTVSRKAPAKSKNVARKAPVAKNTKPSVATTAVKSSPKVTTDKPAVSKLKSQTAVEAKTVPVEKQATAKPEVKAAKVVEKSVPASKPTNAEASVQPRRARQPSKPPAMPETPKK